MLTEIIFGAIDLIILILCIIFQLKIRYYLKAKAPGIQTPLDFRVIDTCFIAMLVITSYHLGILFSIFIPTILYEISATIVIFFHINILHFLASVMVTTLVKTVLLYRFDVTEYISDRNILIVSRVSILFIASLLVLFDYFYNTGNHFLMVIISRNPNAYR